MYLDLIIYSMNYTTNIILKNNDRTTQPYVVQLEKSKENRGGDFVYANIDNHYIHFFHPGSIGSEIDFLYKNENDWYNINVADYNYQSDSSMTDQYIIRVYFPQYSVDTFHSKTKYILSLSTWIKNIKIDLGNFLFERKESLACPPKRFGGMDEYCEYVEFTISDVFQILQSNDSVLRDIILGDGSRNFLDMCSQLYVSLFVVDPSGDQYIKNDEWDGAQNCIDLFNKDEQNDLKLHMNYDCESRNIILDLKYHDPYSSESNIEDYLYTIYYDSDMEAITQYLVMDEENIYYEESRYVNIWGVNEFTFNIDSHETIFPEFENLPNIFSSWDNWKEGLNIKANISFYKSGHPEDIFMTIFSNRLVLTKELFSKMVQFDMDVLPKKIDLTELDMIDNNLTAINKIIQENVVVTPTDSTKNHLIQPVFYQTKELSNFIVHPDVTENIAINLDSYKSQVSRFRVQVEGVIFNEIGRSSKGVIFKIQGNMLPKNTNEGDLYILNQDNELVTTGKYIYSY